MTATDLTESTQKCGGKRGRLSPNCSDANYWLIEYTYIHMRCNVRGCVVSYHIVQEAHALLSDARGAAACLPRILTVVTS